MPCRNPEMKASFLFNILGTIADNWIYSHLKNKSIKLPFQTKDSKHLVSSITFLRTRSDDAWPLIEFTLCGKQKYQVTFVTKNKISRFIYIQLAHTLFQTSRLISPITKPNPQNMTVEVNPIYEYLLLFYGRINMAVLNCNGILFSHTIKLNNRKFDWLFIGDLIWLVWHTYISLTDSLTHPLTRS